jgi:ubiquinone/menaquinone biosynthesis C-methylase UbiE
MKNNLWKAYSSLAWTESIISSPEEYQEETEVFCRLIKKIIKMEASTMLHLGCGAGLNDWIFKNHFQVTGIDISEDMLNLARQLNPELSYICGDMRTIRLKHEYNAVVIPDSIGYMTSLADLRQALSTAFLHLKPDGAFMVVSLIKEDFRESNFVYSGSKGDLKVTLFENNTSPQKANNSYEATFIYLIRDMGKLNIYTDSHTLGLFTLQSWLDLLAEAGFKLSHKQKGHFYKDYILGEGEYPLTIFVCTKSL